MYQPPRGESSPDNGSRSYRRRGRRWDDEDKGNNEYVNSDIGSSRDRSRSREKDNVESRRNQRTNPGEAKYTPGQKSNWSDSSSDEDMSSKSLSRKYERYPRYSRENISGQKDYYDTLGNEAFDSTNEFRNQIPLNLSGSVQKTDSQGMISKFSMQMKAPSTSGGISIKLGSVSKPKSTCSSTSTLLKSTKVAAVFNADDDDEPEEMPAECKMRMKNVGRETPTSAGPNSFGKTKIGFCNITHITEKKWEEETSNKK